MHWHIKSHNSLYEQELIFCFKLQITNKWKVRRWVPYCLLVWRFLLYGRVKVQNYTLFDHKSTCRLRYVEDIFIIWIRAWIIKIHFLTTWRTSSLTWPNYSNRHPLVFDSQTITNDHKTWKTSKRRYFRTVTIALKLVNPFALNEPPHLTLSPKQAIKNYTRRYFLRLSESQIKLE